MSAIATGYVRSPTADWFWFILLQPLAVIFALITESWLTFVALASVNLWITVPHHFGTWCRTFGLVEDWSRFRARIIIGPLLIIGLIVLGLQYAPLTTFLVVLLWDHQHSVMQQHGIARIYDFKAKSGGPSSGRIDLWLNIVLYLNLLLTVPLWSEIWIKQLYLWNLPVEAPLVRVIQLASTTITVLFLIFYMVHLLQGIRQGNKLNPMKYAFLLSSYGLWYFAGWHTNSLLVYGVAHKLMHGLQYLVVVYWFLDRKQHSNGVKPWMLPKLNGWYFAFVGLLYSMIIQLLLLRPFGEYGFGVITLFDPPAPQAIQVSPGRLYEIYATTVVSSTAVIHYYFDSFIWKIRDEKTQTGL
jgi:hypothetical protein